MLVVVGEQPLRAVLLALGRGFAELSVVFLVGRELLGGVRPDVALGLSHERRHLEGRVESHVCVNKMAFVKVLLIKL